jgi:hypothetical protein
MSESILHEEFSRFWHPTLEDFTPARRVEVLLYWEEHPVASSIPGFTLPVRPYCGDCNVERAVTARDYTDSLAKAA